MRFAMPQGCSENRSHILRVLSDFIFFVATHFLPCIFYLQQVCKLINFTQFLLFLQHKILNMNLFVFGLSSCQRTKKNYPDVLAIMP
jgi:hypothetical protein